MIRSYSGGRDIHVNVVDHGVGFARLFIQVCALPSSSVYCSMVFCRKDGHSSHVPFYQISYPRPFWNCVRHVHACDVQLIAESWKLPHAVVMDDNISCFTRYDGPGWNKCEAGEVVRSMLALMDAIHNKAGHAVDEALLRNLGLNEQG